MMRWTAVVFVPFAWACTTKGVAPDNELAALAPVLSVERFLSAVNADDLASMARIFGTERGPIGDTGNSFVCALQKVGDWLGLGKRCLTWQEVETQMHLVALVLRHEDYRVVSESTVPGRRHPTRRVAVEMKIRGKTYPEVPFILVRSADGRWLVEDIGLTRVTGG